MPAYKLFSDTEVLGRMAMERMLAGLSTLRYRVELEPVGARTEQAATATSKSAVLRRLVATVLDGSKALRRAALDVCNQPVIARCQLHKLRKV